MTKWDTDIRANIQTYIDSSNMDNGDTLLRDFVSESMYKWDLPVEAPPYPVFYTLYPGEAPEVTANGFSDTSLLYSFNFDVTVKENAGNNLYQIGHRYLPMLTNLFNDIILKGASSAEITTADVGVTRNQTTGSRLLVSGITWQLSIPN